jgi:hypothetical protein
MRISWRELDWISDRDRTEIERRMHVLGGESGLDRVDFIGRASSAAGGFEIRITANAAKRQIIAVRRDTQRVKAFNSAFEALERSVVSVLKNQPSQARVERGAAPRATPKPSAQPRPALAQPEATAWIRSWVVQRGARTALAVVFATTLVAIGWVALRMQREPRAADIAAGAELAAFSAVADFETAAGSRAAPAPARRGAEPVFSAVARFSGR